MKKKPTIFMVCFLLVMSGAMVFAAPNAERLYTETQALDLENQSLASIKQSYEKLDEARTRDFQQAKDDMLQARSEGKVTNYRDAYTRLEAISGYAMSEAQSDQLLNRILAEEEPSRSEYASWLYEVSPYYSPILTLDFSASGEDFHFSYRQQMKKAPGSEVVLPDQDQMNFNADKVGVLAGWGLTPNEVTYQSGETIAMPNTDQTLFAIWDSEVRFFDSHSGNEVVSKDVEQGTEIEVPTPASSEGSSIFVGWYDKSNRTLLVNEKTYTVTGKGASFEALWKDLSIEQIKPLYYAETALPTQTQLGVGFSFQNTGNIALEGLQATLKTDSPYVTFLADTLFLGSLGSGSYTTNNSRFDTAEAQNISGERNTFRFVVSSSAPSQSVIPFTLTLTDAKGDSWSSSVEFTIK